MKRLLIANRGEIAVRISRTAREMEIETVGVYAEADAGALHAHRMDRSVPLGPGSVAETYLAIPRLLEAARSTECDAVHPGYGLLSENAGFAKAVIDAGLCWVGPAPDAIARMGDKVRARALMEAAKVPVTPGSRPEATGDGELRAEAVRLGFPVLIKASAGGGGKGMSRVDRAEDLAAALAEGRRLAAAAFGDGTVYLERLLEGCRHIEFQIFGDESGRIAHLFERECSVQRRHQKIVEEAPSTALDPALRRAMGDAAVRAARAVNYVGAGTVEFLLDTDDRFYFLEMNTRLQVEHPVTEETLGCDLVRAQIDVAQGRPLPDSWIDGTLSPRGHAIEMRLYAEDPVDFLPRSGALREYEEPSGPGVRVDSGVERGGVVGLDYDPLLAKLIVWGPDRPAAIARAQRALSEWLVLGIETNLPRLRQVLASQPFASGRYATDLIARLPALEAPVPPDAAWIAAALTDSTAREGGRGEGPVRADPWDGVSGWRVG